MRKKLPIILSRDTRTGIMIAHNEKLGGCDMIIVGLNKEVPSGEEFEIEDISWIKGTLHFADTEAMRTVANVLKKTIHERSK